MGNNILFIFAGTGDTASMEKDHFKSTQINDESLIRVFFNGCHDSNIGGRYGGLGYISPNLDVVVSGIRQSFNEKNQISLENLRKTFANSIIIEPGKIKGIEPQKIDNIFLKGYSRGGVTTFAFARKFNDLNIPISIFAVEPIPGNSLMHAKSPNSECAKNFDLSACKNIKTAEIILGTYQNSVNILHNNFYRQMVPIFNNKTDLSVYAVPIKDHGEFSAELAPHFHSFLKKLNIDCYTDYEVKRPYPIPRVLQQKFHMGVIGRKKLSPFYKSKIKQFVIEKAETLPSTDRPIIINQKMPFRTGQALLALLRRYKDLRKIPAEIKNRVLKNEIAICDFIIEIDSIIQFCLENVSLNDHKSTSVNNFLKTTDLYSEQYLTIPEPTFYESQSFENEIIKKFIFLKKDLPNIVFDKALKTLKRYLEQNPFTHAHIAQFLTENQSFYTGATLCNHFFDDKSVTINLLARKLYLCSEGQKMHVLNEHKAVIETKLTSIEALSQLAWLLPIKALSSLLNKKNIKDEITTVGDLIKLFKHLPKLEHRMTAFKSINLARVSVSNFSELIQLMGYLPSNVHHTLLNTISNKPIEIPLYHKVEKIIARQLSQESHLILKTFICNNNLSLIHSPQPNNSCIKSLYSMLPYSFFSKGSSTYTRSEVEVQENPIGGSRQSRQSLVI